MSRKKVSGNTMTLKDFHGGSIPADLPLPSAPGVAPRVTDRPVYERTTSWGNPIGRSDHRTRPHSSHSTRQFDDKTPFLAHTAQIGRNFDEDERKPLDGVSGPRRTISDDSFRVIPARVEPKQESVISGRVAVRPGLVGSSEAVSSYAGKVSEVTNAGLNSQTVGVHSGHSVSGNAWGVNRQSTQGFSEPVQSPWVGQAAGSKLVNASALDKVSSGRWQSKHAADVEVVKHSEPDNGLHVKKYNEIDNKISLVGGREYSDGILGRQGLKIEEGVSGGRKEVRDYERTRSTYLDNKDWKQATHTDGKFGGSKMQQAVAAEVSDRPKLKLLPRTKPLEDLDQSVHFPKQAETESGSHGNVNPPRPVPAGNETLSQPVERPKLNLKPRVQQHQQSEEHIEGGRNAVFGGARPRELVLKERGIEDVVTSNHDLVQNSERFRHNTPKTEHAIPSRQENPILDQRSGRKFEKKDKSDVDKSDAQRKNWRNENRRNIRENDKLQQQPQKERHPSPETWRKPVVEQPKLASPDENGPRSRKAASAVELAQAFSRSFSDPKVVPKADDRHSSQRGLPGRTQVPFSRLMNPSVQQINGY